MADEQSIGQEEFKDVSPSHVESAVDDMLHSGALVLCNPVTSSIPDTDSKSQLQQPEAHLHELKVLNSADGVTACKCESDFRQSPEHSTCTGHHGKSSVLQPAHFISGHFQTTAQKISFSKIILLFPSYFRKSKCI